MILYLIYKLAVTFLLKFRRKLYIQISINYIYLVILGQQVENTVDYVFLHPKHVQGL